MSQYSSARDSLSIKRESAGDLLDAETRERYERYLAQYRPFLDEQARIAEESKRMTAADLAITINC